MPKYIGFFVKNEKLPHQPEGMMIEFRNGIDDNKPNNEITTAHLGFWKLVWSQGQHNQFLKNLYSPENNETLRLKLPELRNDFGDYYNNTPNAEVRDGRALNGQVSNYVEKFVKPERE